MASYILRTIDPELWAKVKGRAEREGLPLRVLILALLQSYADGKVNVPPRSAKRSKFVMFHE